MSKIETLTLTDSYGPLRGNVRMIPGRPSRLRRAWFWLRRHVLRRKDHVGMFVRTPSGVYTITGTGDPR